MKDLITTTLTAFLVLFLASCDGGGSSDSTATTTTGTSGVGQNQNQNGGVGGGGVNPGTQPGTVTYTPLASGYGESPKGELLLEFEVSTDGRAYAQGEMNIAQDFGFLQECVLPVGQYLIQTSQPGQKTQFDHTYINVLISATGPRNFTALIERASAMQNIQNEWVMYARMQLKSVNGKSCTGGLNYSMPFLNQ